MLQICNRFFGTCRRASKGSGEEVLWFSSIRNSFAAHLGVLISLIRENGVAHANPSPVVVQIANILLILSLLFAGVLFSAANVFPFDMDERLACLPDGRFIVEPHYDVRRLTELRVAAFGKLLDRYFNTDLANVQLFDLKFANQVAEYEQVHNFAFPNVPRRIGKIR